MSGQSTISRANRIFRGNAYYPAYLDAVSANDKRGIIVPAIVYHEFGAVLTADADGISASQSVTDGNNALINGALASGGSVTFDVPRNVVAAWTTTATITITGTDEYGEALVEQSAAGTSFTGKKAFKTVTQVTITGANVTLLTVGSGVLLGLPFAVGSSTRITTTGGGGAATIVTAVATDPATATTGDVRGTVSFANAPDDSIVYGAFIAIPDTDTKEQVFGVDQYGG